MKNLFLIYILLFPFILKLYSNNLTNYDSLAILNIENQQLVTIIDSIVTYEKNQAYYNPDFTYYFFMEINADSSYNISIGTNGYMSIKFGHEVGCFIYKDHTFIVESQLIEKMLFIKTEEIKLIKYYVPRQDGVIDMYENDSFTNWYYKYEVDHFIFLERYPPARLDL